MSRKLPRVALLIETSRTYGRGIMAGIARYAHVHGPWSFFTQERELHSSLPDWLRTWKGDGIIARIEDRRTAKALLRSGVPVVDVLGNARFKGIPGFDTYELAVARRIPDGDPAVLTRFASTPRQSNDQIWALPPESRVSDGAMLLSFLGVPFASHWVLATTSLRNPVWANLGSAFADGLGLLEFVDTNAPGNAQRFYRAASP